MAETTPVTVLTGFLGAGKTTLLNHLLRQSELAGAAVLVNEFGEIGVDHLLVEKLDEATVLLNAGCLCCTVRGDLLRVLRGMLPRARRREISRIVIETTGLADPVPILATLMSDAVTASVYRLDGIVTVVDAVNGMAQLDNHPEAVRQVAVADRIVLSKADITDSRALLDRVRRLNPNAGVVVAIRGAVAPDALLHAGPFESAGKIPDVQGWLEAEASADAAHEHAPHDRSRHDAHINTFSLTFDAPLAWERVNQWLGALTAAHGASLLRIKGVLDLVGQQRPIVIQGVHHVLYPPAQLPAWPVGEGRSSRLVFITRNLPRSVITAGLP